MDVKINQENFGMSITANKLNGKIICCVQLLLRIFLRAKGKEKYIIQSPPLTDDKNSDDWVCDDA